MRNLENNYNSQTNTGNTGWESLGDEEFEGRRNERAKRRYERMQESERAKAAFKALIASAVLAIAVAGGAAAGACSTPEIMDTSRAERVEAINIDSVTIMDGPFIRDNPAARGGEDGSTFIMDFGEEGQTAHIPYRGEAYYYNDEQDPNGGWYGFNAEQLADEMFENAYISKSEANRIKEKDEDNTVWINEKYVRVNESRTENKIAKE